jgi:hypothetical protein
MTNDVPSAAAHPFPPDDDRLTEAAGLGALDDDADASGSQAEDPDRLAALPREERDDPQTLGGGLMGAGGTAAVRGTGTLSGTAQARGEDEGGLGSSLTGDEAAGAGDEEPDTALPDQPIGGTG